MYDYQKWAFIPLEAPRVYKLMFFLLLFAPLGKKNLKVLSSPFPSCLTRAHYKSFQGCSANPISELPASLSALSCPKTPRISQFSAVVFCVPAQLALLSPRRVWEALVVNFFSFVSFLWMLNSKDHRGVSSWQNSGPLTRTGHWSLMF